MFSSIIAQATSLFNPRSLLSVFFPSLILWMLTVALVAVPLSGWENVLKSWTGLSGTAQAVLLIGFFAWVAFWSFLVLNFKAGVIRIYEGYWSTRGLPGILLARRRRKWQKRWDGLSLEDQALEEEENILRSEQDEYQKLRTAAAGEGISVKLITPENKLEIGQEIDRFLDTLEKALGTFSERNSDAATLQVYGQQVRTWWLSLAHGTGQGQKLEDSEWSRRRSRLKQVHAQLSSLTDQRFGEISTRRLRLDHEILTYYPPRREQIMPTRFGNVLKAAETYSKGRYHIDAVLIWSRLQVLLPKEYADPFQDAETSVEQMILLSSSLVFFGVPLSVWLAIKSAFLLAWWVPVLAIFFALLLRSTLAAGLAFIAFILALIAPLPPHALANVLIGVQYALVLLIGVFLLSWISYQNAVQSALGYGEQIKAAFDLYRWKVLDQLHLQRPKDYRAEQKLWDEICGLLYRGYAPDLELYRYSVEEQESQEKP